MTTAIRQLTKVRTPPRLNKLRRWIKKTRQSNYSLHVLTQKSELNLMSAIFQQNCINTKLSSV